MKKVNNTEFQLNTRIRIKNIIGEDSYLNGMTGTVCEPFAFAESGPGWIGVILDSSKQPMPYGGKCNIRINECEIISAEDIIEDLCNEMLADSFRHMKKKIKSVVKHYKNFDPEITNLVAAKIILAAVLEHDAIQYKARGTCFEKEIKKCVEKAKYYI